LTRAEEIKAQQEEIARRFGANVRRARRRVGISQLVLAERAHLHRTEIGLIERGLRAGRIDTLIKLSGALDVAAVDLLEGSIGSSRSRAEGTSRSPGTHHID
jgi:transcriptional regulator with XRE-family HTH domain